MSDLIRDMAMGTFGPVLQSLSNVLDKGLQHAVIQGWPANRLPEARLAPDMFPLTFQVRLACTHAKDGVALLTGREAPAFDDGETTLEGLKSLIGLTARFLEATPDGAFAGAAERQARLPLQGGVMLEMTGLQFLRDWAFPNFYFHVVTAYDILRSEGVEIGKADYMGHVGYAIRRPVEPSA